MISKEDHNSPTVPGVNGLSKRKLVTWEKCRGNNWTQRKTSIRLQPNSKRTVKEKFEDLGNLLMMDFKFQRIQWKGFRREYTEIMKISVYKVKDKLGHLGSLWLTKKKKVNRDHDVPNGSKAHKISLWQEGWNSYLKFWGSYWLLLMDVHLMGEDHLTLNMQVPDISLGGHSILL